MVRGGAGSWPRPCDWPCSRSSGRRRARRRGAPSRWGTAAARRGCRGTCPVVGGLGERRRVAVVGRGVVEPAPGVEEQPGVGELGSDTVEVGLPGKRFGPMARARISSSMATWAAKPGERVGTGRSTGSLRPRMAVEPMKWAVRGTADRARIGARWEKRCSMPSTACLAPRAMAWGTTRNGLVGPPPSSGTSPPSAGGAGGIWVVTRAPRSGRRRSGRPPRPRRSCTARPARPRRRRTGRRPR